MTPLPSRLSLWTAALFLLASPALAHVNLERPDAKRGTSYKAVFKVPHGCDGAATHTLRVEIPEGFIGVKPMPKPGWTIDTVRGAYAKSYGHYHGPLSEGVKEIQWSGGELPDAYYDEFAAAGFLAREIEPGKPLYFKVVQVCTTGENRWVEVPAEGVDPHSLDAPAAVLRIAAEAGEAAQADAATAGTLAIEDAWTRATAEGAKVGAGYLTIRNTGTAPDTLVAVEAPFAGRGEIHEMSLTDDGVMRMRALAAGVEIPAGGSVTLKPGGMHLMFLDLKEPLVAGASVPVKLTFKSGAVAEITLPVRPLGGKSDGDSGDKGGGSQHHEHHHHHH